MGVLHLESITTKESLNLKKLQVMKWPFICLLLTLNCATIQAQLPPWNLELYVYHPDGDTDSIWVGCDENATLGYDEDLETINSIFEGIISLGLYNQSVEDIYNLGTCSNLINEYKPFDDVVTFELFVMHNEISVTDIVYIGWDTTTLGYEYGEYKISYIQLESELGYIDGIDGTAYSICTRPNDSTILLFDGPIDIWALGDELECLQAELPYVIKLTLKVGFKDYSLDIDSKDTINTAQEIFFSNPIQNTMYVECESFYITHLTLHSLAGIEVGTYQLTNGTNSIDLSMLSPGIYLVSYVSNNSSYFNIDFIGKIIKL